MQEHKIFRYEIWQAVLPVIEDSHVQNGRRPVIVVSNDMSNAHSPLVTVIPLTSNTSKCRLPTHVLLEVKGLRVISLALCEQIMTIDKRNLTHYMGRVRDPQDRLALNRAMSIQLGMTA